MVDPRKRPPQPYSCVGAPQELENDPNGTRETEAQSCASPSIKEQERNQQRLQSIPGPLTMQLCWCILKWSLSWATSWACSLRSTNHCRKGQGSGEGNEGSRGEARRE